MKMRIDGTIRPINFNLATRCPHCGHYGTFEDIENFCVDSNTTGASYFGIKKCPNANCRGQLFYIADNRKNVLETYPADVIPFDKDNIPDKILNAFEEAVKCHGNSCFIASAIMIRKTLEEICQDRGAKGKTFNKD